MKSLKRECGAMAYRFKLTESLSDGVRRIALELIDGSHHLLTSSSIEQAVAVHEFRKNCKKMRGLLKLVRSALGETYQQEYSWYRDIARELSHARDAQVLVQTVDALREGCRHHGTSVALEKLRGKMERRRLDITAGWINLNKLLPQLAEQIANARYHIADWPLEDASFSLIEPGLKASYRKGRKAFHKTQDDSTDDNWHDWRKRVKEHGYHIRLLRTAWPVAIRAYEKELDQLADLLGTDHDLSVLSSTLDNEPDLSSHEKERLRVVRRTTSRQRRLRRHANQLGELVFAETPSAMVARLQAYWEAGQRRVS